MFPVDIKIVISRASFFPPFLFMFAMNFSVFQKKMPEISRFSILHTSFFHSRNFCNLRPFSAKNFCANCLSHTFFSMYQEKFHMIQSVQEWQEPFDFFKNFTALCIRQDPYIIIAVLNLFFWQVDDQLCQPRKSAMVPCDRVNRH